MSQTIHGRLRTEMKRLKVTQEALAAATGVSQGAVSGWLKNSPPGSDKLAKIASHLNLTVWWLLKGEGVKHPPTIEPYGFPKSIDVHKCIAVLDTTEPGIASLICLWKGLMEWGESVSEHGRGEQAEAFTNLVMQAILFGDYERVFEALKAHMRGGKKPSGTAEFTEDAGHRLLTNLPKEDAGS